MTGIIKSVLALQKEIIPPNINFEVPNPKSTATSSIRMETR